ncbi:MAG: hypothetical protein K2Q10_12380 [Rhodospirillales bacterium]|nr:hypothetical protein [Rhodospirillales bacterium]
MATEVYSCKPGQALKDGKLDYAHHIETKEQAEGDAKRRCLTDPSLAKIAYYKVNESGDFRIFYTYTNPNLRAAPKKKMGAEPPRKPRKAAKSEKPHGLWQRLKAMLGG